MSMKKVDLKSLMLLCEEINKKEGKGTVYSLGSKDQALKIPRWSTGIEDLDAIIGGGMPCGRTIEIFGPESSGKTSLLYHLCGVHDYALDIPIEGTFDLERAKIFGNREQQLLVYRARYGEDAFNKAIQFAKENIPIIGIDSVPSLIPKDEVDKLEKSVAKDDTSNQKVAAVASLITKYLPLLESVIEVTGTTVVFVNQVRDKMDAMLFGEKTDTPGGHKLRHSASLRIQVARKAWIEIPNKNPMNSAEKEKVGLIMKCRVVKSKVCNPMGECEIPLFFSKGFVSFSEVDSIRKELMEERRKQFGKKKGD